MNAVALHDLETWYQFDEPPRCEALEQRDPVAGVPGHACTVTARWTTYFHGVTWLWCDGRHEVWLRRAAAGVRCVHCDESTSHWVVLPL